MKKIKIGYSKSSLKTAFKCTNIWLLCVGLSAPTLLFAQEVSPRPYKDTTLDAAERAADLVGRMTLEEKAAQLVNDAPAIPRLGVREYNWWNEGLHGVASVGHATVFPQAIGMAATWNEPLFKTVGDLISTEFRAKYLANQHRFGGSDWFGGLTVWSPNINIFRDPRWGRGQETYGEDPYLTSRLGVAFIKGLQGNNTQHFKTIATPKHYAVHSGPEANRHREDVHPSAKDLEETYLPAFKAAVIEGGAQSVMCAYNAVDGVPACGNTDLLNNRLRKEWGFEGYVVSDCDAVGDIYKKGHHEYSATPPEAVALAFKSGMDLICGPAEESEHILQAIEKGLLSEAEITLALKRLFTARIALGQFDAPHTVFPKITAKDFDSEANRQLALTMAQESLVLLKNSNNTLPLKNSIKSIAVIGPNADNIDSLVGNYNGSPSHPVTVLEGIKARFKNSDIHYIKGSGLLDPYQFSVPTSALCVDKKCRKEGIKAEYFSSQNFEGESISKSIEQNASLTWEGELKHGAVRFTGFITAPETGAYTFRYEANGGYRIWIDEKIVINAWGVDWRPTMASGKIELTEGKRYAIKVEAFQRQTEGSERLVWSLPSNAGSQNAIAAAKKSDVVVFVAGLTAELEGEEIPVAVPGFNGGDRTRLDLPTVQENLLKRIANTGKPIILVLMNGSALSINWADNNVPAIVEAWYPGGQGGEAVAKLIAGDYSPGGRLPVTFYKSIDDLPPFSDYSMANRTYRYFTGEALYPFGYGLSYTQFSYNKIKVSPSKVSASSKKVTVSVQVANTGKWDGDEVVQLYLSRPDVDGAPIQTLVGFQRIHLKKGAEQTVKFTLRPEQLRLIDDAGTSNIQPGTATLWVGGGLPKVRKGLVQPAGIQTTFNIR